MLPSSSLTTSLAVAVLLVDTYNIARRDIAKYKTGKGCTCTAKVQRM